MGVGRERPRRGARKPLDEAGSRVCAGRQGRDQDRERSPGGPHDARCGLLLGNVYGKHHGEGRLLHHAIRLVVGVVPRLGVSSKLVVVDIVVVVVVVIVIASSKNSASFAPVFHRIRDHRISS